MDVVQEAPSTGDQGATGAESGADAAATGHDASESTLKGGKSKVGSTCVKDAECVSNTCDISAMNEGTCGRAESHDDEGCEMVCFKDTCTATRTNPIGKKAKVEGRQWKEEPAWITKTKMAQEKGCCGILGRQACDLCCPPTSSSTTKDVNNEKELIGESVTLDHPGYPENPENPENPKIEAETDTEAAKAKVAEAAAKTKVQEAPPNQGNASPADISTDHTTNVNDKSVTEEKVEKLLDVVQDVPPSSSQDTATTPPPHKSERFLSRISLDRGEQLEREENEAERKEQLDEAQREKLAASQRFNYAKSLEKKIHELEISFLQIDSKTMDAESVKSVKSTKSMVDQQASNNKYISWWTDEKDCEERVKSLKNINYKRLKEEYDSLTTKCQAATTELSTFIREQLSLPRENIKPQELQTFLLGQAGLPDNINMGICHLYKSDTASTGQEKDIESKDEKQEEEKKIEKDVKNGQ